MADEESQKKPSKPEARRELRLPPGENERLGRPDAEQESIPTNKPRSRVGCYLGVLFLIAIAVLSFFIFLHVVLGAAGGAGFGGAWYK